MFQLTPCAVKAPQIHTESSAVGEPLLGEGVNNQWVFRGPARKLRPSSHDAHDGVFAVVGNAKDLLCDLGRYVPFVLVLNQHPS